MKGDILKKFVSIFLATVMMASSVIMAFAKPILKGDVLTIEDLHVGMKLQGTVRNVVDFGVFSM